MNAPRATLLALLVGTSVWWAGPPAAWCQHLSPLAPAPDWSLLESFQGTITRDDFVRLLRTVYAPGGVADPWLRVGAHEVAIQQEEGVPDRVFRLRFAADPPAPHSWRAAGVTTPSETEARPLAGIRIALDPGHIGGEWARMEERWFKVGDSAPVVEGDIVLAVARLIAPRLQALGAEVIFVRDTARPLNEFKPAELRETALRSLKERGVTDIREDYSGPTDPQRTKSILWESERLFYRIAEIRRRGEIVNHEIKPDLVICLHLNAEEWGNPAAATLVKENHLHLLINGAYEPQELRLDDVRFEMLRKLLSRAFDEELALAEEVAASMARATGLQPYEYRSSNAHRAGTNPYVWTRNLLANRTYHCPVLYIEPYVMNNREVFERIQLGDYEGTRLINAERRESIYQEYANSVVAGLVSHYLGKRRAAAQ